MDYETLMDDEEREEIAVQSIRNYLNKDFTNEYIKKNYRLAIKRMVHKSKQFEENKPNGLKSITEGDVSMSFENVIDTLVVDDEIKALLPQPYIKMY